MRLQLRDEREVNLADMNPDQTICGRDVNFGAEYHYRVCILTDDVKSNMCFVQNKEKRRGRPLCLDVEDQST